MQAPVVIRRASSSGPTPVVNEEIATNISLAGVYFETADGQAYQLNDAVITSVSIPESHTREFPFTRLAGRSRVVRVKELPQAESTAAKRFGVALEFGSDVTALTARPSRG
ncbi:MAG: hypothetical protein HY352_03505 [Candidatus Omnitrophica bacterium]|nr:hypothetical protein [Candidatus Omnitrophota bacterium]